jgi:ACS family hexuronate transporter-like MFS transporter
VSRRYGILVLILAAQTVANVGPLGIPAIAALIREDLDLSLTQAGSFLSAYYIGPIVMSVPAGTLADRWGVRRTLVIGQVLIAAGLVAASVAPTYPVLAAMLVVAGFGYGFLNPTSTKAVMAWFPPAQRATMVGLKQVGLPFGGALGAALLPPLALAVGWRQAVVIAASLLAVTALASVLVYRDPPPADEVAAARSPGGFRAVLLTRDLWLVALATLPFAGVQTVWMAFLVLYLTGVVGVPLLAAARYLAVAQVAGMTGRIVFGVLSDRVFNGRRRPLLLIAGGGTALCCVAIALTGPGSPAYWLAPLAFVGGFTGIGWNGVQHTLLAELAGSRAAGTAVGLGLAISSIGVMVGPPIFGWCVELAGGYGGPWIGLAVAMLGALALLAPVRERPRGL